MARRRVAAVPGTGDDAGAQAVGGAGGCVGRNVTPGGLGFTDRRVEQAFGAAVEGLHEAINAVGGIDTEATVTVPPSAA